MPAISHSRWFKRIAVLCSFVFIHCAGYASALPDFPFVTVQGTASKELPPDRVDVSFTIEIFDEKAEAADRALADTTVAVLAILSTLNIPDSAITAYEISKYTKRERGDNYQDLAILGYEMSRDFTVELSNIDDYAPLFEALMKMQNVADVGSNFSVSNADEITLSLISAAAANAKAKAQTMAAGLDVKLGKVFAFNDSGSFDNFFASFGVEQRYSLEAFEVSATRTRQQSTTVFIPQTIELSKTVNVIYRIEP
ncbi:DUF541 domain-containing protein [Aestuariibacter sp. GS-14]|uniref:SIMPL domain-containing protein n=1 Tax=Aestuariibacter sp. GS-14 TaxID=2590670 RepID=UPI00112709CD|nr:SIMPL domain-containing protein [Aestuariibacter sp. GS-14]TPV55717.1 DUF541 domain-containing protein [Aestuariibacter sp. GS-14]